LSSVRCSLNILAKNLAAICMQMPLISWGAELAINQWAAFAATRATSGKLKLETADWPRTEPKISSSKPAAEGLRDGLVCHIVWSIPRQVGITNARSTLAHSQESPSRVEGCPCTATKLGVLLVIDYQWGELH